MKRHFNVDDYNLRNVRGLCALCELNLIEHDLGEAELAEVE